MFVSKLQVFTGLGRGSVNIQALPKLKEVEGECSVVIVEAILEMALDGYPTCTDNHLTPVTENYMEFVDVAKGIPNTVHGEFGL